MVRSNSWKRTIWNCVELHFCQCGNIKSFQEEALIDLHLQWISWLLCVTGDQWDCGLWKEGWDWLYRAAAGYYTWWSHDRYPHVTGPTTLLFWLEPCLAPVCSGLDTEETIFFGCLCASFKKTIADWQFIFLSWHWQVWPGNFSVIQKS